MRNIFILLVLMCNVLVALQVMAQQDSKEHVFVHVNSQMFISGETMYFATYCNSELTKKPSTISKILYLEIVGENGPIHQQKVYLKDGVGNCDFFISSVVPSGKYYIIAYTQWMKNFNEYFLCPVVIINPFEPYINETKPVQTDFLLFPLHDPLVEGVENKIAYHLNAVDPGKYNVRIVAKNGEVMLSFKADQSGLGMLKFTPQKNESYQVVLEDDHHNVNFYNLPSVAMKGSFVVYRQDANEIALKCESVGRAADSLNLTVYSEGAVLYNAKVWSNSYFQLPQNIVSPGAMYDIRYFDRSGNVVAKRSIIFIEKKPTVTSLSTVGKRKRINVTTKLDSGVYSISVRRNESEQLSYRYHAMWDDVVSRISHCPVSTLRYLASGDHDIETLLLACTIKPTPTMPRSVMLLPENREEILLGSISDSAGNPAANQKIALTFPWRFYQLRVGQSDEAGNFLIPFQSVSSDSEAILTALDFNSRFSLRIRDPFFEHYPELDFQLPSIDSTIVKDIIARSIRIQIENAYVDLHEKQPEATAREVDEISFHEMYLLDKYTRFSSLKETFTEYVTTANVRDNRDDVIKTTYFPGLFQSSYKPLVLLDGVPVEGDKLIQFSPYLVESIGVLPNRYFLGPLIIDGIIGVRTFGGDLGDFQLDLHCYKRVLIKGVSKDRNYVFPDYSVYSNDRIPDQRDQLYWNPAFVPGVGPSEINFYTSDVSGEYAMVIEGFTSKGKPVSMNYFFNVE